MRLALKPLATGDQVRQQALETRMFRTDVMPWECNRHEPVELRALGRTWTACSICGFMIAPRDRELVLRLLRSTP